MITMNTKKPVERTRRCFEEEGEFYIGSAGTGNRIARLLCFRNRKTKAVGASVRFSREEAWRKSRRSIRVISKEGAVA